MTHAAALVSTVTLAMRDLRKASTPDGRVTMGHLSAAACDVERLSVPGRSTLVSFEPRPPATDRDAVFG